MVGSDAEVPAEGSGAGEGTAASEREPQGSGKRSTPRRRRGRTAAAKANARRLKLKPADPFELIRWLARSQSDPRKAVAELVQNSLDAGARHVEIERVRVRRVLSLRVRDDGEGVLPHLERDEALAHIATHIGHSYKLGLDAGERMNRVVAGKYGVGLLGFWALGQRLELRSRVAGSRLRALRMEQESPTAEIVGVPLRTDALGTFTEVVIAPVHPAAQRSLGGRRLSEYLAAELRGQILSSGADVVVHDRVARGLAKKRFVVAPRRFAGERLRLAEQVEIAGFAPLRVELYLARGAERPAIQVACAGTLVADDIGELQALGLDHPPWCGCELSGNLDFPAFSVPPGSRRGVQPDAAAEAFVAALGDLQLAVQVQLDRLDRRRQAAADRDIVRELSRALKGLASRLPHYDLPAVGRQRGDVAAGDRGGGGTKGGAPGVTSESDVTAADPPAPPGGSDPSALPSGAALPPGREAADEPEAPPIDPLPLLPPGPLEGVHIVPERVVVAPGNERRVRAQACDGDRRPVEAVTFEWRMPDGEAVGLGLCGEGARLAVVAEPRAPLGGEVALMVVARQGERTASALAAVRVAEPQARRAAGLGVPEPMLVSDPEGGWRSRMVGERWEVNEAHRDYLGLRDEHRGRLRYLLSLLAKEIVLRTTGRYDAADLLESLVELLAHAEQNLRGR